MSKDADAAVGVETDHRGSGRVRLELAAKFALPTGTLECLIDDLSRNGARITAAGALHVGDSAFLRWADLERFCEVVWMREQQCGLEFDEPLTKEQVMESRWRSENYQAHEELQAQKYAQKWVGGSTIA